MADKVIELRKDLRKLRCNKYFLKIGDEVTYLSLEELKQLHLMIEVEDCNDHLLLEYEGCKKSKSQKEKLIAELAMLLTSYVPCNRLPQCCVREIKILSKKVGCCGEVMHDAIEESLMRELR